MRTALKGIFQISNHTESPVIKFSGKHQMRRHIWLNVVRATKVPGSYIGNCRCGLVLANLVVKCVEHYGCLTVERMPEVESVDLMNRNWCYIMLGNAQKLDINLDMWFTTVVKVRRALGMVELLVSYLTQGMNSAASTPSA